MQQITKAQQIKDILEPIPAEKFIAYRYASGMGECCSLGHIHVALSGEPFGDWDGFGARELTNKYLSAKYGIHGDIACVNNDPDVNGYTEPVIKDRVMHLIEDMIKDGY